MKVFAFDSGIGGLSALFPVLKKYPGLSLEYLGDLANLPYGSKSPEHVLELSLNCARHMIRRFGKPDAFIVACNTASALAGDQLKKELELQGIPTLDVLSATLNYLKNKSAKRWIVLATSATVKSKAYQMGIEKLFPKALIHSVACPLFVPMVEDFLIEGPLAEGVLRRYLDSLNPGSGDLFVLGCTHYPYLSGLFKKLYPTVELVDSGTALINALEGRVLEPKLLTQSSGQRRLHFSDKWSSDLLDFFLKSELSSREIAHSLSIESFNY